VTETRQTILVADDDPGVRKLIVSVLGARGFLTLEAQNGLEAVQLYGVHRAGIALVITDVQMPVMDGIEALARMTAINPDVRVIVVSGRVAEFARPAPAVRCWLAKPFAPKELLDSVESALGGGPGQR
jgi:CheY-like chemotaxis protein